MSDPMQQKARKILHDGARIPPPSRTLIERMAKAGFEEFHEDDTDVTWRGSAAQDRWRATARAMYAMVATSGGAKVEDIPEPTA